MARKYGKNNWALFLLILCGIVLGSYLGFLTKEIKPLAWLNYGLDFGIGNPKSGEYFMLDLVILVISIGFRIKITIASIIGTVVSVFVYKKI